MPKKKERKVIQKECVNVRGGESEVQKRKDKEDVKSVVMKMKEKRKNMVSENKMKEKG